jgi:hypothetical protein
VEGGRSNAAPTDLVHAMLVPFYAEYPDEVNEGKLTSSFRAMPRVECVDTRKCLSCKE